MANLTDIIFKSFSVTIGLAGLGLAALGTQIPAYFAEQCADCERWQAYFISGLVVTAGVSLAGALYYANYGLPFSQEETTQQPKNP